MRRPRASILVNPREVGIDEVWCSTKRLKSDFRFYRILQISSLTVFKQAPMIQLLKSFEHGIS